MLMRKSFRMEDTYFRKNSPKDDVLRLEFGMDAENYVIIVAGIALGVLVVMKMASVCRSAAMKRRMRKKYCKHCK